MFKGLLDNGLDDNLDSETNNFQQTEGIEQPLALAVTGRATGEASTNPFGVYPIGNDTNSISMGGDTTLSFNLNANGLGGNLNSETNIPQQSVLVDAEFLYFLWVYKVVVFGLLQKLIQNITSAICLGLGFYICNHFIFPFLDKLIYNGKGNGKDK